MSVEPPVIVTCGWRTGVVACRFRPTSGKYCAWHAYWARLVDVGGFSRQQREEFAIWWEQFQPTGIYAENPGPWWADQALLWEALTGQSDPPKFTDVLARELYTRRAEVRRYLISLPMCETPWPRVSGLPLPTWIDQQWKAIVDAQREIVGPSSA